MSLEDIFPMVIAILLLFVFTTLLFKNISGNLEERKIESMHGAAIDLTHILVAESPLTYKDTTGLLDSGRLDEYADLYDELNRDYGPTGYNFSITVIDLVDPKEWIYDPGYVSDNSVTVATPVAIRYGPDKVNEGLFKVRVWRRA